MDAGRQCSGHQCLFRIQWRVLVSLSMGYGILSYQLIENQAFVCRIILGCSTDKNAQHNENKGIKLHLLMGNHFDRFGHRLNI